MGKMILNYCFKVELSWVLFIYRRVYLNFKMVNGKSFFWYDDWISSLVIRRELFVEYSLKRDIF